MATTKLSAEVVEAIPQSFNDTDERVAHRSSIDLMRDHFRKQSREKVRIAKEKGQQTVQINGYTFQMQAGVYIEVPTQVADVLREADLI